VRAEAANLPRFEPAPIQRATPPAAPPAEPTPPAEPHDDPVLRHAQRGMALETPPVDPDPLDDDPYFAELRRAMSDKTPLGPREDDWGAAENGVRPPPSGSGS
jgi:hypothetical protein